MVSAKTDDTGGVRLTDGDVNYAIISSNTEDNHPRKVLSRCFYSFHSFLLVDVGACLLTFQLLLSWFVLA